MTKTLFIETRQKFEDKDINFSLLDKLPGKTISLAATIQYLDLIPTIKKYLEKNQKKVILKKGAFYEAHVLGCNSNAFDSKSDTLLLLTDGKFHAINNAVQLQKEIYVFNTKTLEKVSFEDIQKINNKRTAAIKKFLSSDRVGILVTTKPGQNYKQINQLKNKIEKLGKRVYIFESNNINIAEFENFKIQIWVNTACFGLAMDNSNIVNFQDILQYI